MKNTKNNFLIFMLLLFTFWGNSCIIIQDSNTQDYSTVDSISGDFNKDSLVETIKVLSNKNEYYFAYYNSKGDLLILNKNIFFQKGDLGKDSDFIYLSYNDTLLNLTQEFGSTSPNGWYIAYISHYNNELFIDSIEKRIIVWKEYQNTNEEMAIESKSKIIMQPINNFNLTKELLAL